MSKENSFFKNKIKTQIESIESNRLLDNPFLSEFSLLNFESREMILPIYSAFNLKDKGSEKIHFKNDKEQIAHYSKLKNDTIKSIIAGLKNGNKLDNYSMEFLCDSKVFCYDHIISMVVGITNDLQNRSNKFIIRELCRTVFREEIIRMLDRYNIDSEKYLKER